MILVVHNIHNILLILFSGSVTNCFESVGGEFNYMYWFELTPDCPEKLKTQFEFYTANGTVSVEALTQDRFNFTKIDFNDRSDTKIIVHGWGENIKREWIHDLKLDFQKQVSIILSLFLLIPFHPLYVNNLLKH